MIISIIIIFTVLLLLLQLLRISKRIVLPLLCGRDKDEGHKWLVEGWQPSCTIKHPSVKRVSAIKFLWVPLADDLTFSIRVAVVKDAQSISTPVRVRQVFLLPISTQGHQPKHSYIELHFLVQQLQGLQTNPMFKTTPLGVWMAIHTERSSSPLWEWYMSICCWSTIIAVAFHMLQPSLTCTLQQNSRDWHNG